MQACAQAVVTRWAAALSISAPNPGTPFRFSFWQSPGIFNHEGATLSGKSYSCLRARCFFWSVSGERSGAERIVNPGLVLLHICQMCTSTTANNNFDFQIKSWDISVVFTASYIPSYCIIVHFNLSQELLLLEILPHSFKRVCPPSPSYDRFTATCLLWLLGISVFESCHLIQLKKALSVIACERAGPPIKMWLS